MYRFAISCEQSKPMSFDRCETLVPPEHVSFDELDGWIEATLNDSGWTAQGDKHYCPKHNPANKGKVYEIDKDYVEIAPGVRVRWPGDGRQIEVQCSVRADVLDAVEALKQQREADGAVGSYDMVDHKLIDLLIDYVAGG